MANYIVWGTGQVAEYWYEIFPNSDLLKENTIVAFCDSSLEKQGGYFHGYPIIAPQALDKVDYDYISIWVGGQREQIAKYIVEELNIPEEKIADIFAPFTERLCAKYAENTDEEMVDMLRKVRAYPRPSPYYFEFAQPHDDLEVFDDAVAGLSYCMFEGKRMYLSREFTDIYTKSERKYIHRDMWWEQDPNSPHLYEEGDFCVRQGDVIVDVGTCEGNFTLHHIDEIKHAYIFEGDSAWLEALHYTFLPYSDKVTICDRYVGSKDEDGYVRLDTVIQEKVDL